MPRSPVFRAALPLLLALVAAACGGDGGGDKSEADLKDEISKELQADGDGLPEDDADCFADIIIDEVGADKLRDVDISATELPAEIEDEFSAATTRAIDECDLAGAGG